MIYRVGDQRFEGPHECPGCGISFALVWCRLIAVGYEQDEAASGALIKVFAGVELMGLSAIHPITEIRLEFLGGTMRRREAFVPAWIECDSRAGCHTPWFDMTPMWSDAPRTRFLWNGRLLPSVLA